MSYFEGLWNDFDRDPVDAGELVDDFDFESGRGYWDDDFESDRDDGHDSESESNDDFDRSDDWDYDFDLVFADPTYGDVMVFDGDIDPKKEIWAWNQAVA